MPRRIEWTQNRLGRKPQQPDPQVLQIEVRCVKVQRESRHATQIDEGFAYFTPADCMIRSVRFSVRFFEQTHPELLVARAAEGQPHLACKLRPAGVRYARQLIVDDDMAPLAVEEESQQIAAAARGRCVYKQARDEVVPLSNNGQRAQEPTVADSTLQQVVRAESKVSYDNVVRQTLPHIRARDGGAVGPGEELAAARLAVMVRSPLVAIQVALNEGLCRGDTASACDI